MKVTTTEKRQIIDITERVIDEIRGTQGIVNVFVKHTTAAITIADLDPGTDLDFLDFLKKMTPAANWRHPHDSSHAPDHILAGIIGPSVVVPLENGKLQLGAWQRIILIELDGPRDRDLVISPILTAELTS